MPTDIATVLTGRFMDHWVRRSLIERTAGPKASTAMIQKLVRDLDNFATDLAGPTPPSPIERVLIESAALTWFDLRHAEAQCCGDKLTLAQSEHHQRRVERAHRRLISVLKTLAQIRRLGVPALQINLAHQQVNVAGS